jgi:hypothetical protein
MAMISGMVGHSGKFGCHLYCGLPGCHQDQDGHYYPVMLKSEAYNVAGCNHNDVLLSDLRRYQQGILACYHDNLIKLLRAKNPTRFKDCRLETGLCKQTLFSRLHNSLGISNAFPLDIMHLINLNDPDLLLRLWHGTIKVYSPDKLELWTWRILVGNVWRAHGKTVALATPFIPSYFGRALQNPAEKINSGYKAWEFQIYLVGSVLRSGPMDRKKTRTGPDQTKKGPDHRLQLQSFIIIHKIQPSNNQLRLVDNRTEVKFPA